MWHTLVHLRLVGCTLAAGGIRKRRPAVGRRSYLFAGSHAGGERAAIAYSVLASCALCEINPVDYLADVLPRLARDAFTRAELEAWTPAAWKAAHPGPAPPAPA